MQPRRSRRLTAGALVLALPVLGSCGFNKATEKPYTPAAGTINQSGQVDVLSAVIVSAQANSGTFIATLANNSSTDEATFSALSGSADEALTTGTITGIDIAPRGYVNLADGDGVAVQGEFTPGQTLSMTLTYANGAATTQDVPVVYACEWWTGLDSSVQTAETADAASPSADPAAAPSADPVAVPAPGEPYECGAVLEDEGAEASE